MPDLTSIAWRYCRTATERNICAALVQLTPDRAPLWTHEQEIADAVGLAVSTVHAKLVTLAARPLALGRKGEGVLGKPVSATGPRASRLVYWRVAALPDRSTP